MKAQELFKKMFNWTELTQQTLCKLSFGYFAGQHLSDIKGYLGDFDGCVLETQTDKGFRQLN